MMHIVSEPKKYQRGYSRSKYAYKKEPEGTKKDEDFEFVGKKINKMHIEDENGMVITEENEWYTEAEV